MLLDRNLPAVFTLRYAGRCPTIVHFAKETSERFRLIYFLQLQNDKQTVELSVDGEQRKKN